MATVKAWPKAAAVLFASITVGMMVFIIVVIVKESIPAFKLVGMDELFSTQFSGRFTGGGGVYGLIPAIWGTIMTTTIAMIIAVPISLAISVYSSEFATGSAGKWLRYIFGVLTGIPPIVYAFAGVVVIGSPFLAAKFSGMGSGTAIYGYSPNSILLVGVTLALLVIPFMAPLFHDALRNVPRDLKEASYGLGAGRWHTATRIVIPFSLPGLIAATALGSLLAMGEVLIPSMLGTFEAGMPNPFYDIFDRCPTLTSVGTGLIGGGFSGAEASINAEQKAAGMFAAALLIILAFLILITAAILQKRFRKRFVK